MPSLKRLCGMIVGTLLVVAASAAADPITIVGGTLQTSNFLRRPPEAGVDFSLFGQGGFAAIGRDPEDAFDRTLSCFSLAPCRAGSSVDTGAALSFSGGIGSTTVDDPAFGPAFFAGSFVLTGERVAIPLDAGDLIQVQSPFTFAAALGIDTFDGTRRVHVTNVELVGAGTATTFLLRGPDGYVATSRSFEFAAASATPEPASLLLFGTGAALLIRRRSQSPLK